MNIKHVQILSEAVTDLEDGEQFYKCQAQGVGEYFWDSLLSGIESLMIYAGVHSKMYGYYRMSSKQFPYSIYYDLNGNTAYVIAILPERKNLVGFALNSVKKAKTHAHLSHCPRQL